MAKWNRAMAAIVLGSFGCGNAEVPRADATPVSNPRSEPPGVAIRDDDAPKPNVDASPTDPPAAVRREDITLPSTTSDVPVPPAHPGRSVISIAGHGATLGGRVYASEHGEAIPGLKAELAEERELAEREAAAKDEEWWGEALLYADHRTRFGLLFAVARTASDDGWEDLVLFAHRPGEREHNVIHLVLDRPELTAPTVDVASSGFVVQTDAGTRETLPLDFERLEQWAARTHRAGDSSHVRVRVAEDVSLQTFVSAIDALRGNECFLLNAMAGEAIPAECHFIQPMLALASGG